MNSKKALVFLGIAYTLIQFALLSINFSNNSDSRAIIFMGASHFVIWVIIGSVLQKKYIERKISRLVSAKKYPHLFFITATLLLACIEESLATLLTNNAPLFGSSIGKAYITASTNYFDVIFFHSVIVFIPMIVVLGYLLKKYTFSPFTAALLFGVVGVIGEAVFAGPLVILNAPMWIGIYGCMVYLPSHFFITLDRKKPSLLMYPIFVIAILSTAIVTFSIPAIKHHPRTHFEN